MDIQSKIDEFVGKEVKDLMQYTDIDAYADMLKGWKDDIEGFRSECIEYDIGNFDEVCNDIGFLTTTFDGKDMLDYLVKKYYKEDVDEVLSALGENTNSYTVKDLYEIFETRPNDEEARWIVECVLYDALTYADELETMEQPLARKIMEEYSYQICKALGLTDNQIFA